MTYEQARDRCRAAWSRQQMQLSLDVLEEAVVGNSAASSSALGERVTGENTRSGGDGTIALSLTSPLPERARVDSPSRGALQKVGPGPCRDLIAVHASAVVAVNDSQSFAGPPPTSNGGDAANLGWSRGIPAEGV